MDALPELAACGLLSGLLAGLLGIGGGFVVVPTLYLLLPSHVASTGLLPQMAAATSLVAMVPTTMAALASQWQRRAVEAAWLRRMTPAVCGGALIGAWLLPHSNARLVAIVFALYAIYFAARLVLAAHGRRLPAPWIHWPAWQVCGFIGLISVLAGVGGAVLTVPYLESHEVPMQRAVATASGVGLMLSLVAGGAFVMHAAAAAATAAPSTSLVWWTAAAVIGGCAMLAAPVGVALAHRCPVATLKRLFALLVVAAACSGVWKAYAA